MLSRVQPQKKWTAPAAPNQAIVAAVALDRRPGSAAVTLATTSTTSATTSCRKVETYALLIPAAARRLID